MIEAARTSGAARGAIVFLLSLVVAAGTFVGRRHDAGLGTVPRPERLGHFGRDRRADRVRPDKNLLWRLPLPQGHSSPILHGDRIYLTALRDETLVTIAIDRSNGTILWERARAAGQDEGRRQAQQPRVAESGRRRRTASTSSSPTTA